MGWRSPHLPLLLFPLLTLLVRGVMNSGFRICAYNVQKFNMDKASNHRVLHTLTRVVARCDITLLQEVIDSDGKVINTLLTLLNRGAERYEDYNYQSVSSKALGNSPSDMQQYVFIFRTETANVTDQHQYERKQSFVREPFAIHVQSEKTEIKTFVLVALHTEPSQAVQEIDRLYDVFEEVSNKWNNSNVMFLGDFHASCAYVTRVDKKNIRLFTDSRFSWLIGDKVDTTVSDQTTCAYDRIVVYGQPFLKAIKPFSAKVFNIRREFKLKKSKVLELSDHLPVEVKLKGSAHLLQATPLPVLLSACAMVQSFLSTL